MKTLKKVLFIGLMAFIVCLARTVQAQELYKNEKAPIHERIMDLLSRLTVEEKISLLRATSPGISRLDIPKYYHGNEALHGVVRPGRFTVFPQAIGLAATWNPVLQKQVATVISDMQQFSNPTLSIFLSTSYFPRRRNIQIFVSSKYFSIILKGFYVIFKPSGHLYFFR